MKPFISFALILMLSLLWPAGSTISAPSRFSEPASVPSAPVEKNTDEVMNSIARENDGVVDEATLLAKLNPPASDSSATALNKTAEPAATAEQSEAAVTAKAGKEMVTESAAPRPATTIAESLSGDESESSAGQAEPPEQDETVEWVGKDRRIKRVRKVPASIYLKSQKPADKLIITDDFNQSKTELLGISDVRQYGARPDESKWLYSGSKFVCELRHPIPGFGFAVMKQGVDDPLQFLVETDGISGGTGRARIQSRPPIWKRFTPVKDLGVVPIEAKGKVLFSLEGVWVKRLLLELKEGMQPTISFWDDDTGGDDVIVTVSSFNSQKHLPDFAACLGNLLPYSFKDVRTRTLYFGYDKYTLSAEQTGRLRKLIEYVKLDETVKKVDIVGYSDSVGFARYNQTLAQRRAAAVKKFLLAEGLPADKLAVTAKGEKDKKHTNRTEEGRRKNRRVEVTLIK